MAAVERVEGALEQGADEHLARLSPLAAIRHALDALLRMTQGTAAFDAISDGLVTLLKAAMRLLWRRINGRMDTDQGAYRSWILLDMVASHVGGVLTNRVVDEGFDSLNGTSYLDWWMGHGVVPEGSRVTAESSLGQFAYDLVFGYGRGGATSPRRPGKPVQGSPDMDAGVMLRGIIRFAFGYRGAPTWMFQAGCGEALVAPVYEVLRRRGVRFAFFHKVESLAVEGSDIGAIHLRQQATPLGEYEPLFDVEGIPAWPAEPLYDQLREGAELQDCDVNLESAFTDWVGERFVLRRGEDFDLVLLGITAPCLSAVTGELAAASPRWARMLDALASSRPFVIQALFDRSVAELGWPHGMLNGDLGRQPVNLLTSMDGILATEPWSNPPRSLVYFSGVTPYDPNQPTGPDPGYPAAQQAVFRDTVLRFFQGDASVFLPSLSPGGSVDWSALHAPSTAEGEARLDAQRWHVSMEPTERYVLSVTGSTAHRPRADESGFGNLVLAGDWTRTGLDCGSMESAFMSGMMASRAISGWPAIVPGEHDWR